MPAISTATPSAPSPRFRTLFVLGIARCGSTLLGRMLDMHPQILSVGELMHMDNSLQNQRPCSCGQQIADCPFWSDYLPEIKKRTGLRFTRYTPGLYHNIRVFSGHDIIVDLSKTRVWRMMHHWSNVFRWRRAGEGYIFLVRDSRGVTASSTRDGQDLDKFLKRYEKWMHRLDDFMKKVKDRAITVHYEKLCRQPAEELEKICDFLGVGFDRQMLLPADRVHHLVHSSKSAYMKSSNTLVLDERWRRELSSEEVRRVESVMAKFPFLKDAYL